MEPEDWNLRKREELNPESTSLSTPALPNLATVVLHPQAYRPQRVPKLAETCEGLGPVTESEQTECGWMTDGRQ